MELKMEVYSPFLELLGLLEVHNSVIFERKAFSAGSFSINALITEESKRLLVPENIIWIAGETAGIIEYVQQQVGEDGPYISVKGPDLTGALSRYILWGRYSLSGFVPAIMYHLVDDCCINPTLGPEEARVIPGLVLAGTAPAGGASVITQKTGGTLLEALEELGETYRVAFGVRFNPAVPQMEFWARPCVDRTIHQDTNDPVFYSTELDDVLSSEYSYNAQNYRNVALVAGEGEGKDRTMVVVNGEAETPPTPPAPPVVVEYTITLSVDPAGGGVATGGGKFESGQSITVTATPSSGYDFAGWKENGAVVSTDTSYTFTATADRALTALFAVTVPTYTISATIDPAGSGTVTGAGQYKAGTQVTLTAVPGEDYKFVEWKEHAASRLPAGYTELEYIYLNGYSTLNTGIDVTTSTTRILMDVSLKSIDSNSQLFCAYKNNGWLYILKTYNANQWEWHAGNPGYDTGYITCNVPLNQRLTVDMDTPNSTLKMRNDTFSISPSASGSGGETLMFGYRGSSTGCAMDFYGSKIYVDGDLKADYVPCKNASDQCGLYNLVTGEFIANSSTASNSDPTAGPKASGDTTVSESAEYTFTVSGDMELVAVFEVNNPSRLPVGYTELEYVQFNHYCSINTGLTTNGYTSKWVMDIESPASTNAYAEYILYADSYSYNRKTYYCQVYFYNSHARINTYPCSNSLMGVAVSIDNIRTVVEVDFRNYTLSIGDTQTQFTVTRYNYNFTNTCLGAKGSSNSGTFKLFSAQMYTNDELTADFVPCTDPSGTLGVYDLVRKAFYSNSGTGTLTPGPAV